MKEDIMAEKEKPAHNNVYKIITPFASGCYASYTNRCSTLHTKTVNAFRLVIHCLNKKKYN